jgi:hypothetical protein
MVPKPGRLMRFYEPSLANVKKVKCAEVANVQREAASLSPPN